jgi:enoyl-CoA hydratase/carnithine racemase
MSAAAESASCVAVRSHGEHVVEVVLDRPSALNAVSTAAAVEITATMRRLSGDSNVRAVVVTSSSDRAFCVGADLKERAGFNDEQLLAQRPVIRELFASVRELPMPSIAAVNGFALGGGFELALSCDVIVADETAVLGLTEVTVGLVPGGGGTQLLSRRAGAGAAAEFVLSGKRIPAEEALRSGIVQRVVPAGEARRAALELADAIAANSPLAVRAAKRALAAAASLPLDAGLGVEDAAWREAAVSADRREGIAAFTEKRRPRWSGR